MITESQIADFANRCTEMRQAYADKQGYKVFTAQVSYSIGKKYAKLYTKNGGNFMGSVWAFIDMATGDIYKPASFAAPAKHKFGNISSLDGIGPYGPAYLR